MATSCIGVFTNARPYLLGVSTAQMKLDFALTFLTKAEEQVKRDELSVSHVNDVLAMLAERLDTHKALQERVAQSSFLSWLWYANDAELTQHVEKCRDTYELAMSCSNAAEGYGQQNVPGQSEAHDPSTRAQREASYRAPANSPMVTLGAFARIGTLHIQLGNDNCGPILIASQRVSRKQSENQRCQESE
ncbi:hypothetical protein CONPUDRAFT_71419 [Coniophora puteana RWD-64-598 SS2]|uniref:Uncharacterized protein n=1 Tax=Coniophora puteana (strain RWD-64-598) TaxID=741705 RepID=A0A5M3MUF8_CONPW|nr:uncharacterized protein CONPUDRAFT_71419 [Coniophora puteana RWD-64-598 SS2]EIW82680.1 hypothetical protein CONPUDRAFT_71419 [Coniophora puteana RWD-64-598 SS2]